MTRVTAAEIDSILEFWFDGEPETQQQLERLTRKWFASSQAEDDDSERRFGALAAAAANGELDAWSATPRGRLALIILLDQLPRSIHRGTQAAFAQDPKALMLCLDGLAQNQHLKLRPLEQLFFCMPLQHAENREIQQQSVATFGLLAKSETAAPVSAILRQAVESAAEHRTIVDRFGRFPHRNEVLGRRSTADEVEYLAAGAKRYGQ